MINIMNIFILMIAVIIHAPKLTTNIEERQCKLHCISSHQRSMLHLCGESHRKKKNHRHRNTCPKLNATATLQLEIRGCVTYLVDLESKSGGTTENGKGPKMLEYLFVMILMERQSSVFILFFSLLIFCDL